MDVLRCVLCRSGRQDPLFEGHDRLCGEKGCFRVVRCSRCGLIFLNPRPSEEEIREYYTRDYYSFKRWSASSGFFRSLGRRWKWRTLSRFRLTRRPGVPPFIRGGKILDLGCGSGEVLGILERAGWEARGVDVDQQAVAYARSKGLKAYSDKLEALRFPDQMFDVIRLRSVLEHLHRPDVTLAELHRILKSGGLLLVVVPNIRSLHSRLFREKWYHLDLPRHLYHFSLPTLKALLEKHGFSPLSVRTCGSGGFLGSLDYVMNERRGRLGTRLYRNKVLRPGVYVFWEAWLNLIGLGDLIEVLARKEPAAGSDA